MRQIVEDKPFFHSKTFWTNLIVILIAVLTFLLDHELIKDNVQVIQIFTAAIGLLNLFLRLLTRQPIRFPRLS
jgi:hypothetical protein